MLKRLLVTIVACVSCFAAVGQEAVKASSFGFDPTDATKCLQAAIDSGAKMVVVDNVGKPWIVKPITMRSDLELVFDDDVLVLAKADEYHGIRDCMFQAIDAKNITVRGGKNSELRMRKKDYQDGSRYSVSEWRHVIAFFSCQNVTVRDLTLKSSGGDGLYLGVHNHHGCCKDVLAENLVCDDHHRSAVSVICGRNILIRNCVMSNTRGTAPEDGFSLEPNLPDEEQTNIVFENCESFGNANVGAYLHNWAVNGDGKLPPISITFKNCHIHDNGRTAFFANPAKPGCNPIKGTFDFIGCTFASKTGRVLGFGNSLENGTKFTFKDCTIIAGKDTDCAIHFSGEDLTPFGNIDLGNLKVIDEVSRPPFRFGDFRTQGISTLTGAPTYQVGPDGTPKPIDLPALVAAHQADKELQAFLRSFHTKVFDPKGYVAEGKQKGDETGYPIRFRGQNKYIQCVPKGTTARVRIKVVPFEDIPSLMNPKTTVTVIDKSGVQYPSIQLTKEEQVVELKAERGDQVYVLSFNTRNPVNVCSDSPGHGMVATSLSIANSSSHWYFNVPADCTQVTIAVKSPTNEYVTAELLDSTGKVVDRRERKDGLGVLKAERTPTQEKELWSVRFTNAVEDYTFMLGEPLEPIVFTAPANSIAK